MSHNDIEDETPSDFSIPKQPFKSIAPSLKVTNAVPESVYKLLSPNLGDILPLLKDSSRIPYNTRGGDKLTKAQKMLMAYGFDPLEKLIMLYSQTAKEVARQELIRDGLMQELLGNGKPRAYRPEIHMMWQEKLISISDKLLRYGYGRVSETTVIEAKAAQGLVINTTKKGEKYISKEDSLDGIEEGDYVD